MSQELVYVQKNKNTDPTFSAKQIEILKNGICRGCSDEEFEVFLMACKKTQLDPFMRQIYAVKRLAKKPDGKWGEVMTIQTGIDGYRLIAERTGRYVPGPEPTFNYDEKGVLISATAYVKKITSDSQWHTISASAYLDEYKQVSRDGTALGLWQKMPRTMLAKCAEALALRRAFPAEMSGIYTKEEMSQADSDMDIKPIRQVNLKDSYAITSYKEDGVSESQIDCLKEKIDQCDPKFKEWVFKTLKDVYNIEDLKDITPSMYDKILEKATYHAEKYHAYQTQSQVQTQETSTDSGRHPEG